ncbi:carboxypeptidase regulatory-like domain-containing protein [Myxococcus sp. AM011]|nr:carboxypeptidase regulatory-like domain-containing protein [Myxococcus sp. AM011]
MMATSRNTEVGLVNAVIPRLLCGLLALFASRALAQSSTIIGTVIDARSRQPVPDVFITATSPNLQGEQTVVSDAEGHYRIPRLPPGVYLLRFEQEVYKSFARTDVQLRLNRTIRLNVELMPKSPDEMVEMLNAPCEVYCCLPTAVDVDPEFIKRITVRPAGEDDATRSAQREAGTVTQEPSVKRAPPQYNFSPAMPGMSMTLRLHPVPSTDTPRSPRRGEPLPRARPLRHALPRASASRAATSVKQPHTTCARTASSRSLR